VLTIDLRATSYTIQWRGEYAYVLCSSILCIFPLRNDWLEAALRPTWVLGAVSFSVLLRLFTAGRSSMLLRYPNHIGWKMRKTFVIRLQTWASSRVFKGKVSCAASSAAFCYANLFTILQEFLTNSLHAIAIRGKRFMKTIVQQDFL